MTTNTTDLAKLTTAMLSDSGACPTAPLTDVACAIAEQFPAMLDAFVARLQAAESANFTAHYPSLALPTISIDAEFRGRRFIRIVEQSGERDSRRVVCFVEKGTGLIYKAASFKKPVENFTRGCIFNLGAAWQTADGKPAPISPHF